jgi:pimeloyl-ACP methyl ester carboxylesterase
MTLKDQSVAVYARDLKTFLDRLAIERPVLIGWSMGAFVIWDYVRQFGPRDISAAVVVDQAPSDFKSSDEPNALITIETLAEWHHRALTDRAALVHDLIPMMFAQPPAESEHCWMFEEMTRQPEVIAAAILVDQTLRTIATLSTDSIPTLVCYGAKIYQPKDRLRWIAEAARSGEAREVRTAAIAFLRRGRPACRRLRRRRGRCLRVGRPRVGGQPGSFTILRRCATLRVGAIPTRCPKIRVLPDADAKDIAGSRTDRARQPDHD